MENEKTTKGGDVDTEVKRKLASVQKVLDIQPIPGADRIEKILILGWHVVVKKGEFEVGDFCVYFEVDSVLPRRSWSEFLVDENRPDKPIRLKTIRLRKQVSQGLAISVKDAELAMIPHECDIGYDVTERLGVTKYEPPLPAELQGMVRGNFPSFLKKTDTHRIQAHPRAIEELKACDEVYMTIKYDGTSSTFYNRFAQAMDAMAPLVDDFGVCSRNMDLKHSETNTYWKMAEKYELARILAGREWAIQAETHGLGIQGNRLGLKDVSLGVFDAFDIQDYRYFDLDELIRLCDVNALPMVKVVYRGPMKWDTVDELVALSESMNYPNHTDEHDSPAEGIIIRPTVERYSESLQGRLAVKVISPRFLLKHGH